MVGLLQILILLGIAILVMMGLLVLQVALAADTARRPDSLKLGLVALLVAAGVGFWCFQLMNQQTDMIGTPSAEAYLP